MHLRVPPPPPCVPGVRGPSLQLLGGRAPPQPPATGGLGFLLPRLGFSGSLLRGLFLGFLRSLSVLLLGGAEKGGGRSSKAFLVSTERQKMRTSGKRGHSEASEERNGPKPSRRSLKSGPSGFCCPLAWFCRQSNKRVIQANEVRSKKPPKKEPPARTPKTSPSSARHGS